MPKANPYRDALICYRLKGLSYLETSRIVGIPKSTARKWYKEWNALFIFPLEEITEIQSTDLSVDLKDIDNLIKDKKRNLKKSNNILLKILVFISFVASFESQILPELLG